MASRGWKGLRLPCVFGLNRGFSLEKVASLFFVTERTFFVRGGNSDFVQWNIYIVFLSASETKYL